MNKLKQLFAKPSPLELATKELVEAEHALLVAQTGRDWAEMSVEYNQKRITRLQAKIRGDTSCLKTTTSPTQLVVAS